MKLFQSLRVAWWAWRGALALSLRPVLWVPLLIVAAVQYAVLFLLVSFHEPVLLPVGLPLVKLLAGEQALHYPVFYFALPTIFSRANLVIGALVGSIAGGAATLLFARGYGFTEHAGPWKRAFRYAATLIPLSLIVLGLLMAAGQLSRLIPESLVMQNAKVRWGSRVGSFVLFALIQALVVYSTAWVVLMGHKLLPSLRDSVRVTLRTFLPTLIVVAVPALLMFPFSYASSRLDLIARKFRPELTVGLVSAQVAVEFLATFFLIGAITRLFLWRMEAAR